MDAGVWARMRYFDGPLFSRVPAMLKRVQRVMSETNAEKKNALFLLQMGLEHRNPLIAGLLWVMGIDALLGTWGKDGFAEGLCNSLGPTTLAFPDWNQPTGPPAYTVDDVALHVYILRSKLGHGVDLREAALDKKHPVDLLKKVKLTDFTEPEAMATILSQAACFLLCQLLEKKL
jgi:hypothetical protein